MSSTMWRSGASLIEQLEKEPYRFEFFQAIRLLLSYQRRHTQQGDSSILEQAIRFRNSISLGFPPSEIESLQLEWSSEGKEAAEPLQLADMTDEGISTLQGELRSGGRHVMLSRQAPNKTGGFYKATLTPAFMGLVGPSGVLPRHYTQHVADRVLFQRDTTTRAFMDIFTSRAVSLFYQSWMKYRLHLQYEADRRNRFVPLVLSLGGLGFAATRDRIANDGEGIADETLAYYVAAIRERPRSAHWFARVVADYFRVPAKIAEFIGQWMELPKEERTSLGIRHASLGQSAFCGGRVWDRQSRIRLTLGPMRKASFLDMLPGAQGHRNLARLFRLMQGLAYDCEVRLILDKRDISSPRLQKEGGQVLLGWVSWMQARGRASDPDDASYLLNTEQGIE
ncbi:type VI secretion system baseplate subunit TssG [Noviherbaspirillum aerium]|uniref:type VI secretion system baseplate subunit TssG n=1 Tax=Noviherbaspirillum aerium TaxID=2588497 RepID=UPI00124BF699|nr:type VI secretion system baseplate subunit TssG [Noviherbaspirillum aerium]